jgi:hypothetical protein
MEQKDLSVLWSGAPECLVCHRTVSGAPGPYRSQAATLGKTQARSAIIHRTVRCAICRCFGSDRAPEVAPQGAFWSRTVLPTVARWFVLDARETVDSCVQVRATLR